MSQQSTDQVHDLEEAKLIIDMKNDEINSLKNSLKMVEIKANKNVSQANYKVTAEKNKVDAMKKQTDRLKEQLTKVKAAHQQAEQASKQLQVKIEQLNKQSQERIKNEREQVKQLNSQIREQQMALKEQTDDNDRLKKQMRVLKRIVNPHKIVEITGKSLQEIPPYTDIVGLLKDKADQISELKEKLTEVTQQVVKMMTEKQRKMSSYEQQLEKLIEEKNLLNSELMKQSEAILEKEQELEMHKQMLDETKQKHEMTYEQLMMEMSSLRTSVSFYEKESIRAQPQNNIEDNLKMMHEMTQEFQEKQQEYLKKIQEIQNQLASTRSQTKTMEKELNQENQLLKRELDELQAIIQNHLSQAKSKDQMIQVLRNQSFTFETHCDKMKQEVDRWKREAEDSLKHKNQLRQKLNTQNEEWKARQAQLLQRMEQMKEEVKEVDDTTEVARRHSRLSLDFNGGNDSIDWEDKFKTGLKNQNRFLLQVYELLTK